jgi:hypothetical protein
MEDRSSEFECNVCLSDYNGFSGVTYAYAVSGRSMSVDGTLYEYVLLSERAALLSRKLNERGTRARREIRRSEGKEVPKIKDGALRDELLVLPGAAMSASDVVHALRKLIEEIERDGMRIGKYKGDRVIEKMDGTLRFEEG